MIEITDEQMWEALQRSCDDQMALLTKARQCDSIESEGDSTGEDFTAPQQ